MTDIISIDALRVDTVIGVYARERKIKQTLFIDLKLYKDLRLASCSDQLEHTLDYDRLTKELSALISETSFKLIEALAEQVADYVLTHFGVAGISVTVHKPGAISLAKSVSVTLHRGDTP